MMDDDDRPGCTSIFLMAAIAFLIVAMTHACDYVRTSYYVPENGVYLNPRRNVDEWTHYHENVGCPILREEQPDWTKIFRCIRDRSPDNDRHPLTRQSGHEPWSTKFNEELHFQRWPCPMCVQH